MDFIGNLGGENIHKPFCTKEDDKFEEKTMFMNLMTDFAFKRLFGSVKNKPILIRFLNILFADEGIRIRDVVYHDKEILPNDGEGKKKSQFTMSD